MSKIKEIILFTFIIQLFLITQLYSYNSLSEIVDDFKSITAYIIQKDGDNYIVDKGLDDGIKVGDLFTLIKERKIIHPVTKKEITYNETISQLKVVQVKKNYSVLENLNGSSEQIKIGSKVLRYENISANFFDQTGESEYLYLYFKEHLPYLKWVAYKYIQKDKKDLLLDISDKLEISLIFIAYKDKIELYSSDNNLINVYSYSNNIDKSTKHISEEKESSAYNKNIDKTKNTKYLIEGDVSYEKFKHIHSFSFYTKISDFLYLNGQLYSAAIDSNNIRVFNVYNIDEMNIKANIPNNNEGLTVQWLLPDKDSNPYIVVNTWSNLHNRVISYLFKLTEKRIDLVDSSYDILGAFDKNKDGQSETLFGQEFDSEEFYSKRIKLYTVNDDKLTSKNYLYNLPNKFTVLSSTIADITGDNKEECIFIYNGMLYIYSGKKLIYSSSKNIGNGASILTYEINPKSPYVRQNTVTIELSPIIKDIDGDNIPELLTIASERDTLSSFVGISGVRKNWLTFFKYKDGQFMRGSINESTESHIKGFTVHNEKIIAILSEKKGLLKDVKETTDIIYF